MNAKALPLQPSSVALRPAESNGVVFRCWSLMRLLRPHIASAEAFVERVTRQRSEGYCLLAAWIGDEAAALAGWRVQENLMHGRHLYIDDLVTLPKVRGFGLGGQLLAALVEEGRTLGCEKLLLDTSLDNAAAHLFYTRKGLRHTAMKYSLAL